MARMGGKGLTAWQRYKNYYMFVCPYFVQCFLLFVANEYPLPDYKQSHQDFTVSMTKSRPKISLAKWMDDYHSEKKIDIIKMTFDFR